MTFTYNPSLSESKDKVRLMIGDTNADAALLQDEEIGYFLSLNSNPSQAAVIAARAIAAKFSRLADTTIESVSVAHSQKAKSYLTLADTIDAQSALTGGLSGPSATGISIGAIDAANADTDRPTPDTQRGQFDNPPRAYQRPGWVR